MSTQSTNPSETDETHERGETGPLPRAKRIRTTVAAHARNGTLATVAGGLSLAGASRTARRDRRRAGLFALVGAALVGLGVRQRWSGNESSGRSDIGIGPDRREAPEKVTRQPRTGERTVSAEARAHLEQSDVLHQSETNPRGTSDEPDVETVTDPDEGDVRFTTDGDDGEDPKPHLDGTEDGDPRVPEHDPTADEDHVEVDLSESAMADEASEATGPNPEQAYPAMEGTDPEPTSPKSPEAQREGAEDDAGPTDEDRQGGEETSPDADGDDQ